jgi:hypothetical protein
VGTPFIENFEWISIPVAGTKSEIYPGLIARSRFNVKMYHPELFARFDIVLPASLNRAVPKSLNFSLGKIARHSGRKEFAVLSVIMKTRHFVLRIAVSRPQAGSVWILKHTFRKSALKPYGA